MQVTKGMGGSAAASRLELNWRNGCDGMNFVQAAFGIAWEHAIGIGVDGIWMDSTHYEASVWHLLAPHKGALQQLCGPMF
jgi:hypothetical protein